MRYTLVLGFAILTLSGARGGAQGASWPALRTVAATSAAPMLAVARLITEEKWSPVLDRIVQGSPAAQALGAVWAPPDARWQRGRKLLGSRFAKILDAYAISGEVTTHIDTELGRVGSGADRDALVAALNGPAGAAIVRGQSRQEFIVATMSQAPNGPKPGGPEWNIQMRALSKLFDDRLGAAMPNDDGTHATELAQVSASPVGPLLMRLWSFVVANAARQLDTAVNLMLFDEQDAINRDIANAAAGRA